jgi:hypothetical protein
MSANGVMHQTTVRFGKDLWAVLEQEAERLGVSAAQYIREATLARLVYAGAVQQQASAAQTAFAWAADAPLAERVEAELDSASAVHAQSRLARAKAQRLRAEAKAIRERAAVGIL